MRVIYVFAHVHHFPAGTCVGIHCRKGIPEQAQNALFRIFAGLIKWKIKCFDAALNQSLFLNAVAWWFCVWIVMFTAHIHAFSSTQNMPLMLQKPLWDVFTLTIGLHEDKCVTYKGVKSALQSAIVLVVTEQPHKTITFVYANELIVY